MGKYNDTNPFAVCFTSLKLRYMDYDRSIDELQFLTPMDTVNVFISFESILNNLSTIPDIENKLLLERNFPTIMESEAINLCAHYRRFFRGNDLKTRVFLYYTDLSSDNFMEKKHNEDYRSYYTMKFLKNPKFCILGKKMIEKIIPTISKIMEFIPECYFIKATNIEGSLIPWIVAQSYPEAKNFIITTDKFETQYMLYPQNFALHYIKKTRMGTKVFYQFEKYLADVFRDENETDPNITIFRNPCFYNLIISSMGDKLRSIDPLKGIGCKTIAKYLQCGFTGGKVTYNTTSIQLIKNTFPKEYHEDLIQNFNCINLQSHYAELSQQQIFDILNQIVDRSDYNSLLQLNREDYQDYPLKLEELTC